MEIREAIIHALDGDAILFIGSGFSLGATNEKMINLRPRLHLHINY